jgi:hypothetical protein
MVIKEVGKQSVVAYPLSPSFPAHHCQKGYAHATRSPTTNTSVKGRDYSIGPAHRRRAPCYDHATPSARCRRLDLTPFEGPLQQQLAIFYSPRSAAVPPPSGRRPGRHRTILTSGRVSSIPTLWGPRWPNATPPPRPTAISLPCAVSSKFVGSSI